MRWPVFAATVMALSAILSLVPQIIDATHPPSVGLRVDIKGCRQPPLDNREVFVWLSASRRVFVNGQSVERADLRILLHEILRNREPRTVYFQADPELSVGEAAKAMDEIRREASSLRVITHLYQLRTVCPN